MKHGVEPRRRRRRRTSQALPRRRRHRVHRVQIWAGWIASLGVLMTIGLGWVVIIYPRTPQKVSVIKELVIRPADFASVKLLNDYLIEHNVVRYPLAWRLYTLWMRPTDRMKRQSTVVRSDMRPVMLLRHLYKGYGPAYARLSVPEGFDIVDIADRLASRGIVGRQDFLNAALDPSTPRRLGVPSVEGYLFPDTYEFALDSAPFAVMQTMVHNWRKRVMPLVGSRQSTFARPAVAPARRALWPDTLEAAVIVASLVQKEARALDEMPRIAGVFRNRLTRLDFQPPRLQSDPTVVYGCKLLTRIKPISCDAVKPVDTAQITRAMLNDTTNPFNTYVHLGLPPSPICNPGISALSAALQPAVHNDFYFVANGTGRHVFSQDYKTHRDAVSKYLSKN